MHEQVPCGLDPTFICSCSILLLSSPRWLLCACLWSDIPLFFAVTSTGIHLWWRHFRSRQTEWLTNFSGFVASLIISLSLSSQKPSSPMFFYYLQIHIHIEVPNELTVSVNLKTSALETQNDDSPEFLYSFKVEHLPPIILTCLLPKSYPSHLPPQFTISVQWLKSAKISHLCHMLDSIWNEQSGQEVIYQWVDWLQSSSLSHLQFDQEIKLSPYNERDIGDRRAISGSVSPDIDISSLKRYNDEQRHENFRKNIHECCICAGEFPGK